jgi:hypothetical protein
MNVNLGTTKLCRKCGEVKDLDQFHRRCAKDTPKIGDGREGKCKACKNAYTQQWREKNPEYHKTWFEEHPDERKAYSKVAYAKRDPDDVRHRSRAYYWANRERCLAQSKAYRLRNADQIKDYHRRRAMLLRIQHNNWANRKRVMRGNLPHLLWLRILDFYGHSCAYCDCKLGLLSSAQQDHVRPVCKAGRHELGNVVPACRECNARKCAMHYKAFMERHGYPVRKFEERLAACTLALQDLT